MAWARWSSDGYMCDVYVYETGEDSYTVHVANYRPVEPIPVLDVEALLAGDEDRFLESLERQNKALDSTPRQEIGGKYAGQTFRDLSLRQLYELLVDMKREGYYIPDWLIRDVRDAMREYYSAALEESDRREG